MKPSQEAKMKTRLIEILKKELPDRDYYENLHDEKERKKLGDTYIAYCSGRAEGKSRVAGEILNILLGVDEKVKKAYEKPTFNIC